MKKRFIISGGGTGGHIFPAVAIANRLKKENPKAEILFIGAKNKMEMKRIPEAGYNIVGLDIWGINRDFTLKGIYNNLRLPFALLKSMLVAKKTIRNFTPDVAIGVGGFASGPALKSAISLGIPTLIQEQNSFPGVTNRILAKKVNKICVAYDDMENYFPAEKIIKTGNPVREEILNIVIKNEEAFKFFGFKKERKTILVVGGSLGAFSINKCIADGLDEIEKRGVQLLWQTGELFYKNISPDLLKRENERIKIVPFIKNMDFAYSVADIIVSRAGALAIAELTIVGAPTILVPFPYAAEDHQTKNAKALADRSAAWMISDQEAPEKLMPKLLQLLNDEKECKIMGDNIRKFAKPRAIDDIVNQIMAL